ncbi:MAG: methylenetetrahydrofolate reductase [Firmicutes bacterium]|nr:methylenetetrahydrofolate reductase [Bacillota bacterium]
MKSCSGLEKVLTEGRFAVTAEIGPPKHASAEKIIEYAKMLKGWVDAVNITDNQTAIVRLSSIAAGVHLYNNGVEPVIQVTCRDRNRIAMQSDLMGAYSLGMCNVLCLSGDHQKFGNHPQAKNVYDVDSIQLIDMVRGMRDDKKFQCGEDIKEHQPKYFIGAVANPFADPFEFRVLRLEKKINAGADFIQTQSIFDMNRFEKFMNMVRQRGLHKKVHILAGVTPLKSARAARFIQKNVAGMIVPDEVIERMEKVEDQKGEGIKIATEQIQQLKKIEGVAGVHIMAINWEDMVPEIVEKAGLKNY